jgi:hypothetical protein
VAKESVCLRTVWFTKANTLFCISFMAKTKSAYSFFQKISAVFMILALLWLTVSTPFVLASQQQLAKEGKVTHAPSPITASEEESNPFGANTEEKTPGTVSFSEEFLHDYHTAHHFQIADFAYHKCENAGTYTAFHGELLVPPPNS